MVLDLVPTKSSFGFDFDWFLLKFKHRLRERERAVSSSIIFLTQPLYLLPLILLIFSFVRSDKNEGRKERGESHWWLDRLREKHWCRVCCSPSSNFVDVVFATHHLPIASMSCSLQATF